MTAVSVTEVRRTAEQVLRDRLPAALTATSVALGGLKLPPPRTWVRLPDFLAITEEQSPAVVVTTPAMTVVGGDEQGRDQVRWEVRVFCVVRGRGWQETTDRVGGYVTAARLALQAEPGLRGLAWAGNLTAEAYTELAAERGRTIAAGSVTFTYTADLLRALDPGYEALTPVLETTLAPH